MTSTVVVLNGFAIGGFVAVSVLDSILGVYPHATFAIVGDSVQPAFRYPTVRRFKSSAEMVATLGDVKFIFTPGDVT